VRRHAGKLIRAHCFAADLLGWLLLHVIFRVQDPLLGRSQHGVRLREVLHGVQKLAQALGHVVRGQLAPLKKKPCGQVGRCVTKCCHVAQGGEEVLRFVELPGVELGFDDEQLRVVERPVAHGQTHHSWWRRTARAIVRRSSKKSVNFR
jgi:hypothetical protein